MATHNKLWLLKRQYLSMSSSYSGGSGGWHGAGPRSIRRAYTCRNLNVIETAILRDSTWSRACTLYFYLILKWICKMHYIRTNKTRNQTSPNFMKIHLSPLQSVMTVEETKTTLPAKFNFLIFSEFLLKCVEATLSSKNMKTTVSDVIDY